ncbi:MAG: type II methionyl aminopeptidase [Candidatus Hodarchaeota archaeon]
MWSREELKDLQIAGKIAQLTLNQLEPHIKPGVSIGALYDMAEKLITSTKGADLAFPPNISIDQCAAHDTAAPNEKRVVSKKALIKIDIGANMNGMLSDIARSYSMDGKNARLIKASREALDNAIKIIKPGLRINKIGEVVQETIEGYGFKPVANLTGHQLERGHLHAGLSIPNIKAMPFSKRSKLQTGMILAIEPFASNGKGPNAGYVEDGNSSALIYSSLGNPKSDIGKKLVKRYQKLPFALRSAYRVLQKQNIHTEDLAAILDQDRFRGYRPLIEKSGGLVSQAEHTVLVTTKGAKILT